MSVPHLDLLTPSEAAAVAGIPVRAVYKAAAERLPGSAFVRRSGQVLLTRAGVICLRLDRDLPKEIPVKVRRVLFSKVRERGSRRIEYRSGVLRYVVDPKPARDAVETGIDRYRKAMDLIVEDPEVQGGAATFRGTRLLVHHIVDLIKEGVPESELGEDYPNLTPEMIAAGRIFARAHPRRGRPRKPTWRAAAPSGPRKDA